MHLGARCSPKATPGWVAFVCDRSKTTPELVPQLWLCLGTFFHTDLQGSGVHFHPDLVDVRPACSFLQKPTRCSVGRAHSHC